MEEVWKDVKGFEGIYQVSNLGRVKNVNRDKVLSTRYDEKGYCTSNLFMNGYGKNFRNHRLVYEAFVGEIPQELEIDHINTIRSDNRVENLRVVTHKKNMNNPITIVNMSGKVGELNPNFGKKANIETRAKITAFLLSDKNPRRGKPLSKKHKENISKANKGKKIPQSAIDKKSKAIMQISLDGNLVKEWKSATIIERELGYSKSNICNCCKGRLPYTYGFIWKYKE